ncbi:MAG TPA: hypothetical protein VJJ22_00920 [Candidatus Paceibacterota bacterium]
MRTLKAASKLVCLFLAFVTLTLTFLILLRKDVTIEYQLPKKYTVVNQLIPEYGNLYSIVKSVSLSGTAVTMPKEQFHKVFANEPVEVIFSERGLAYYLCHKDGHLYVAHESHSFAFMTSATQFSIAHGGVVRYDTTPDWTATFLFGFLTILFFALWWRMD